MIARNWSEQWLQHIKKLYAAGYEVKVRDSFTRERLHQTLEIDMAEPVLGIRGRKLNYRFMAAEALWIMSGRNDLAFLEEIGKNPNMRQFSDNGVVLTGAYGPRVHSQIDWVVGRLFQDESTRQAVLTIWEPRPFQSRDIPCTVVMQFLVRDDVLSMHVYMRSSDAWLGLPYDVFSFSMLAYYLCGRLNPLRSRRLKPGKLFLTMASSHLYEKHFDAVAQLIGAAPKFRSLAPELYYSARTLKEYLGGLVKLPSQRIFDEFFMED